MCRMSFFNYIEIKKERKKMFDQDLRERFRIPVTIYNLNIRSFWLFVQGFTLASKVAIRFLF